MSDEAATLADDAQLLERAVRESWPRSHPELRELLARRPAWVEVLDASLSADAPGDAGLAGLARAVTEEDRRLVDESLALVHRPAVRGTRAGEGRAPYLRWVMAAAAVLAVAGAVALWQRDSAPGADLPHMLGPDESVSDEQLRITLVAPLERVERIESFEWTSKRDLQPGQRYLVILSAVRGDGTRGEELLRRPVDEMQWLPDAYDLVDLPLRLHWSVRRVSANGLQVGQAAEALVERSSP